MEDQGDEAHDNVMDDASKHATVLHDGCCKVEKKSPLCERYGYGFACFKYSSINWQKVYYCVLLRTLY